MLTCSVFHELKKVTPQIFQIKMQRNSSLFRFFWQGMQNLEFPKNYSCRLVKQYASRKNLAIFSHLRLVQVVPKTWKWEFKANDGPVVFFHTCFEASLLDKVSDQFIFKANKGCKLPPRLKQSSEKIAHCMNRIDVIDDETKWLQKSTTCDFYSIFEQKILSKPYLCGIISSSILLVSSILYLPSVSKFTNIVVGHVLSIMIIIRTCIWGSLVHVGKK